MHHELTIGPDFTTENALKHKQELHQLAKSVSSLIIDLRHVKRADLVGINAIVSTHKILTDRGGRLVIKVTLKSKFDHLLQLTKFQKILTVSY
ncbi:MAG: STAS domain-containing protein [Spirosomataceae bacterium]|jgi:anti-anti-sigma regulatory factor